MKQPKDYCSGSPESINGKDLSKCCKAHDNAVGQAGRRNPITPHIEFYKCLKDTGVGLGVAIVYTLFGTIFSWIKYPMFYYKQEQYRNSPDWDGIIK